MPSQEESRLIARNRSRRARAQLNLVPVSPLPEESAMTPWKMGAAVRPQGSSAGARARDER